MPRVTGAIKRRGPVEVRDLRFLRANTGHQAKITLPGPFTMAQQARNEYYDDDEEMAMAYAAAVNEEAHDLMAAGADVVQLDEPWLRTPGGRPAVRRARHQPRAARGCRGRPSCICASATPPWSTTSRAATRFLPQLAEPPPGRSPSRRPSPNLDLGVLRDLGDKVILLGVIDLGSPSVETPDHRGRAYSGGAALFAGGKTGGGAGLRDEVSAAGTGLRQA